MGKGAPEHVKAQCDRQKRIIPLGASVKCFHCSKAGHSETGCRACMEDNKTSEGCECELGSDCEQAVDMNACEYLLAMCSLSSFLTRYYTSDVLETKGVL